MKDSSSSENPIAESNPSMSALSAVESLLAEVGAPLHTEEISQLVIEKRLWKTESRTPEEVLSAVGRRRSEVWRKISLPADQPKNICAPRLGLHRCPQTRISRK